MKTLDQLQSIDFAPHLHEIFSICLEGIEPFHLELVRVTETGQKSTPEVRQPFSLEFLGPVSPHYLLQHIYQLEHEEMGRLDVFLVPLGPEAGRMRYEAIFT